MPPRREPLLTISRAAAYAGVTVRAVRHYHRIGLLPEPPRDESGYRRYRAADIVTLIRIRALSHAGVPLGRVGELLQAGPEELALAIAEIDASLQAEIQRLEEHRKAVAQLATIDALALPPEIVEYLDTLRSLGLSDRVVRAERDGLGCRSGFPWSSRGVRGDSGAMRLAGITSASCRDILTSSAMSIGATATANALPNRVNRDTVDVGEAITLSSRLEK